MRKLAIIGGLLAVLGWGGAVFAAVQFPLVVTEITVDGNHEIRAFEVLDVVAISEGDEITTSDLKVASQAIYDLGWFSEVLPEATEDGRVVFRVVENPVLSEIEISGNVNVRWYKLFGIPLIEEPLMSDFRLKRILRDNDIRKNKVINRVALETALQEVISDYNKRGYLLVMIGDVSMEDTLAIELIEGRVVGTEITGLQTVPNSIPEEMIDLPLGEPLRQEDIERVLSRLRDSVYFIGVDVVPEVRDQPDEVVLVWNLTERQVIDEKITALSAEVDGITRFPADAVNAALGPVPDGAIDNYALLGVLEGVYDLYKGAGYVMVRFTTDGPDADGVLRVSVHEGRLAEIFISGNTTTQQYVIERNLDLRIGEPLRKNHLAVAYQQLRSLGYFGSVNLLPEWTDENEVRVAVMVTERERLGGMNGALALEPSTGGLVGELSIEQKNLFGTGQDVSLSYRRGLSSDIDPLTSTWTVGYTTVAYFPEFDRVGLDLYRELADVGSGEDAHALMTLGARVGFDYPIAAFSDLSLSFAHENEQVVGETRWTPIDSVTVSVSYNTIEDPYFPTQGERRVLSLEKAGGFSASKEYLKLIGTWIQFQETGFSVLGSLDQVFGIRLRTSWGDDALATAQAFELGGPTTVRGTEGQTVHRMFVGNFEHRIELIEGLVFTTFLDAGVNLDAVNFENVLASTGFELAINAAGVFVRLDFAWVLGPEWSWVPQFDVGFGPMF